MEIFSILEAVVDPRRDHLKEYSLECLFYITIAAVLGGAESWYEVVRRAGMKWPNSAVCGRIFSVPG